MIVFGRADWGAKHEKGHPTDGAKSLVIVHHFYRPHVDAGVRLSSEVDTVQGVERYHAEERGWSGIGYNWIIFQSGHVYEGRGWGRTGAHTRGKNSSSVGIAFAVDGEAHSLTPAAIEACQDLILEGQRLGFIADDYEIRGHRDFGSTSCPGDLVYPHLEALRPAA